jgi:hypothetical protein
MLRGMREGQRCNDKNVRPQTWHSTAATWQTGGWEVGGGGVPANANHKDNFGGGLDEVVAIVASLAAHADQVPLARLVLLHVLGS